MRYDLCNSDNLLVLCTRIKERCKYMGITQKVMLSKIGKNESYLSEIWTHRINMAEKELFAIADYLRTTPDYLMGLTDNPNSDKRSYDEIIMVDNELRQLVDRLIETGADTRNKVSKFLDMLE